MPLEKQIHDKEGSSIIRNRWSVEEDLHLVEIISIKGVPASGEPPPQKKFLFWPVWPAHERPVTRRPVGRPRGRDSGSVTTDGLGPLCCV